MSSILAGGTKQGGVKNKIHLFILTKLKLPILTKIEAKDIKAFIDYWSELYSYGKETKYADNINPINFSENNILELFVWKNGSILSNLKRESLNNKILKKIEIVNTYKSHNNINIEEFKAEFKSVSAVWKIFLLHIIKPMKFPIYDQHVHRAYNYINGLPIEGIKNTIQDKEKLDFYFNNYLPLVDFIKPSDLKKMDEAFFAFGKMLNTGNYKRIVS